MWAESGLRISAPGSKAAIAVRSRHVAKVPEGAIGHGYASCARYDTLIGKVEPSPVVE
jgi:hypothetical protein